MDIRKIIKEHIVLYEQNGLTPQEIYEKYYKERFIRHQKSNSEVTSSEYAINIVCKSFFRRIVTNDPTTITIRARGTANKISKLGQYSKWLLELYLKNRLKLEDLYKAREYLTIFHSKKNVMKRDGKEIDIMRYKSLPELYDAIEDYVEDTEDNFTNTELIKQIKEHETERFYEDDQWLIVIPKTMRASCLYGKGTKWCTASKDEENNMFDYYIEEYPDSHLYIFINKQNPKEKYQLHVQSGQLMDVRDDEVDPNVFFEGKLEILVRILRYEAETGRFEPKRFGQDYYFEFKHWSDFDELFCDDNTIYDILSGYYDWTIRFDAKTELNIWRNIDEKNLKLIKKRLMDEEGYSKEEVNVPVEDLINMVDFSEITLSFEDMMNDHMNKEASEILINRFLSQFNLKKGDVKKTKNGYYLCRLNAPLLLAISFYNSDYIKCVDGKIPDVAEIPDWKEFNKRLRNYLT